MNIGKTGINDSASPLVSVIVPVYNAAPYLRECVDSILGQTFRDYEIILIDDGSPDESGRICDDIAKAHKNVRAIHQANGGPSAARNAGLDIARGEYIAFVDSDDRVAPVYLERLVAGLAAQPVQIAVCGARDVYLGKSGLEADRLFYTGNPEKGGGAPFFAIEAAELFNPLWNKLYLASVIRGGKLRFDGFLAEDFDFNISYFYFVESIALINEPLYYYCHRDTATLTSKYCGGMYPKIQACNAKRAGLFRHFDGKCGTEHSALLAFLCGDYLWLCVANAFRRGSPETFKTRYALIKSIMADAENREYLNRFAPKTRYQHIFKALYTTGLPLLATTAYTLLFFLRNRFAGLYITLRNSALRRRAGG